MDMPMTTFRPACVPPYQVEVVRFIDAGKNSPTSQGAGMRRMMVSDLTTDVLVSHVQTEFNPIGFKENIIKYKRVLQSFLDLQDDWDGYGAIPPAKDVIEKSNQILNFLNEFDGLVNIVYPLNEGVQIDFNTKLFKYEIEVYEDSVKLITFDSDEEFVETIHLTNITLFTLNDYLI